MNYIDLFTEALKNINKEQIAYSICNTKSERQLLYNIGYELDKIVKNINSNLFAAIEYKRIDLAIIEKNNKNIKETVKCIFEAKFYYTFDSVNSNKYWFDPLKIKTGKPPKNLRECLGDITKLTKLNNRNDTALAEKYFVFFLGHFSSKIDSKSTYYKKHNNALKACNDEPKELLAKSRKLIVDLFKIMNLKEVYFNEISEFSQIWDVPVGLVTAIGKF